MENNILTFRSRNTSDPVHSKGPWDTNASVAKLISPNLDPWLYTIQQSLKQSHDIFNPDFYKILLEYKILTIIPSGDDVDLEATVGVIDPENGAEFSVNIENMLLLWGVPVHAIEKNNFKLYVTNLLDAADISYTIWEAPNEKHITLKEAWEFNPNTIKIATWQEDQWSTHYSICPDGEDVDDLLDVNSDEFINPIEIPLLFMMIQYAHLLKKYWYYPLQKNELLIYQYKKDNSSTVIHMTYAEFYENIRKSIHEKHQILDLNYKSTDEIIEKIYKDHVRMTIKYRNQDDQYLT